MRQWANSGVEVDINKGVKSTEKNIKRMLKRGRNSDGSQMKPVKEITMDSSIRHGGPDKRKRRNVNSSASRPIQATGESINSINSKWTGDSWEIAPGSGKPEMVFEVNLKLGRDPLQPSDKQVEIIEKAIIKGFDEMLAGV